MANRKTKEARDEAIAELRSILKPGDTVDADVVRVSSSGMSRVIALRCIAYREEKEYPLLPPESAPYPLARDYDAKPLRVTRTPYIRSIDGLVSDACGYRLDEAGGVRVSGCGMNMCFAVVYELGRVLFPDGFGIEGTRPDGRKVRPKSKAAASRMAAAGVTFRGRNGDCSGWDPDGGYAMKYR